jgi:hypothetical protein
LEAIRRRAPNGVLVHDNVYGLPFSAAFLNALRTTIDGNPVFFDALKKVLLANQDWPQILAHPDPGALHASNCVPIISAFILGDSARDTNQLAGINPRLHRCLAPTGIDNNIPHHHSLG